MTSSNIQKPKHPTCVWETARETGLLDTEPEEAFNRLTALAGRLAGAPVALLTILDNNRQFFKAQVGLREPWASRRETPLTHSFCQYGAATGKPLIVDDARQHPWLEDNLAIEELGVIAYCGVPLSTSTGQAIGSLCVIDSEPRNWQLELPSLLEELARSAMTEVELRKQSLALLELTQRQNALLGTVAHDLRTPLTVVAAYSKLLLHPRWNLSDETRPMVEALRRSGEFMLRLVDDILDLAALKSGKVTLHRATTDVVKLVSGVVDLQEVVAGLKGISVRFECQLENLPAQIDPSKLEQVVHNLLGNAIKFSPANSSVVVSLSANSDQFHLGVADSGPGITKEDQVKVFEPFAKGAPRPTAGEKSTGVGLTIVKRLVEAHGGSIRIESEGRDTGATFQVQIPRNRIVENSLTEDHAS